MGNIIIILLIVVIAFLAVLSTVKHFKGEGGCCGGGGELKPLKKKLSKPIIAEKTVSIEGMHCDHCKSSVEKNINMIDGAAAKVNLKRNSAVVSMESMITDDEIISAVENAGFKVTKIELKRK